MVMLTCWDVSVNDPHRKTLQISRIATKRERQGGVSEGDEVSLRI